MQLQPARDFITRKEKIDVRTVGVFCSLTSSLYLVLLFMKRTLRVFGSKFKSTNSQEIVKEFFFGVHNSYLDSSEWIAISNASSTLVRASRQTN